ncbi:MAG TPA: stress response translation initiation inhibitor YciH [Pseudomonadaceae bacterium]|nr:stress response translation initiation inhibitor YciH [Pseudomonadaceae bacterium]
MSSSRPVYSTDQGRLCPECGQATSACRCRKAASASKSTSKSAGKTGGATAGARPAGDGIVRVSRETKGRKGKGVTLVTGLQLPEAELKQLGSALKQLCGTGGTVKDGVIEIQGDQRDRLVAWLEQQGHKVKKAGG